MFSILELLLTDRSGLNVLNALTGFEVTALRLKRHFMQRQMKYRDFVWMLSDVGYRYLVLMQRRKQ